MQLSLIQQRMDFRKTSKIKLSQLAGTEVIFQKHLIVVKIELCAKNGFSFNGIKVILNIQNNGKYF